MPEKANSPCDYMVLASNEEEQTESWSSLRTPAVDM